MVEDGKPAQNSTVPEGRQRDRVTVNGDEFLNAVVEAVSGDDVEKRAWALAMVDHEDTVASFVASVRRALKAVREARGLSIDAAAEQVGVSASTLSRLESGATGQADLKLVTRVALRLGVVPRLDFAAHGAAAVVSVGGLETDRHRAGGFRDVGQPSLTAPSVFRADSAETANDVAGADPRAGSTAPDPEALDRRIRNLEARIAAMERPRPETED